VGARILVVDDSPTIRKVVGTILESRAYEPVLASDGQEALEMLKAEPIDLVLLDFVMPRMNGYQFCREIRMSMDHKHLPVVLMSAKGDKIRGQFVQQTGAIDAITKPFDARGLIAVVEGALKRKDEGRGRPVPDAEAMPEEESIGDSLAPGRLSLSEDPGLRRVQAAHEFATALGKVIVPDLMRVPDVPREGSESFSKAIGRAITPETMGALSTLLRSLDFGENNREVLAGDISVISIAEILQLLDLQRQTGALTIFTRKAEIVLYVNQGALDFANQRGLREEFLLGRFFVQAGVLSKEELQNVLDHRAGSKRLIGELLIQLGMADEQQVKRALIQQTSELVYEVVRWKNGRFSFITEAENPAAQKAALGLPTGALVMEGFRRVDEWQLIEGSFDFNEVLYCDAGAIERIAAETKLTPREDRVLKMIDGERTVREIVDDMGGSSFELCKILYQFLNSRLVRRKTT
jgi:DNA-binding response OmpR family regulator